MPLLKTIGDSNLTGKGKRKLCGDGGGGQYIIFIYTFEAENLKCSAMQPVHKPFT